VAPKKGSNKNSFQYAPVTIQEAWFHLASSVLICAIEDARANKDPHKRKMAREWLLSEDANFYFEMVMQNAEIIDLKNWVIDGCPELKKHER